MEGTQQPSQMKARDFLADLQVIRSSLEQELTNFQAGTVPRYLTQAARPNPGVPNNIGLPFLSSQPRQTSEKSNPQDKKPSKVAGGYSGNTIQSARRLNLQQIRELEKALQAVTGKEAQLKKDLRTVQQEKTNINRSLVSARKQEIKYKRHENKCDVNDIKVKYRRRPSHPRKT